MKRHKKKKRKEEVITQKQTRLSFNITRQTDISSTSRVQRWIGTTKIVTENVITQNHGTILVRFNIIPGRTKQTGQCYQPTRWPLRWIGTTRGH